MKPRWTLRRRLFASYLVVVAVGALTLAAVMALVTPALYSSVLLDSMHGVMGSTSGPMGSMMAGMTKATEEALGSAFAQTVTYSLLLATLVGVAASLAASLFITRRFVTPIRQLSAASQRLASGHYAERVPQLADDELGELAASFNQMAASLEETEQRRLALIGDVAHELRTPLATIEGYAEGLLDGVVEPSPETFALLHGEADRLRRLVEDLQELSRAEARQLPLQLRPVAPAALAGLAEARLGPSFAEKGVTLSARVADGLPPVLADEGRTLQVLTNLLGNALRYTPAGGQVELLVERAGSGVRFAVRDSGIGIAPEHLPHVFERFYRADRSRSRAAGGSGIGLTIAKHLVEAQGGQIAAESAGANRGATFSFTLPAA